MASATTALVVCQQKMYDVSDDRAQCATRDLFYEDVIPTSSNARRPAHVVPSTSVCETASVSETCAASETAVVYSTEDELSKDDTQTETDASPVHKQLATVTASSYTELTFATFDDSSLAYKCYKYKE